MRLTWLDRQEKRQSRAEEVSKWALPIGGVAAVGATLVFLLVHHNPTINEQTIHTIIKYDTIVGGAGVASLAVAGIASTEVYACRRKIRNNEDTFWAEQVQDSEFNRLGAQFRDAAELPGDNNTSGPEDS